MSHSSRAREIEKNKNTILLKKKLTQSIAGSRVLIVFSTLVFISFYSCVLEMRERQDGKKIKTQLIEHTKTDVNCEGRIVQKLSRFRGFNICLFL